MAPAMYDLALMEGSCFSRWRCDLWFYPWSESGKKLGLFGSKVDSHLASVMIPVLYIDCARILPANIWATLYHFILGMSMLVLHHDT